MYDVLRDAFPGIQDLYHDAKVDPLLSCGSQKASNISRAEWPAPPYTLHSVPNLYLRDDPNHGMGPRSIELVAENTAPETLFLTRHWERGAEKEAEGGAEVSEGGDKAGVEGGVHGESEDIVLLSRLPGAGITDHGCCTDIEDKRAMKATLGASTRRSFMLDHDNWVNIRTREGFLVKRVQVDYLHGHTQLVRVGAAEVAAACLVQGVVRHYEL